MASELKMSQITVCAQLQPGRSLALEDTSLGRIISPNISADPAFKNSFWESHSYHVISKAI